MTDELGWLHICWLCGRTRLAGSITVLSGCHEQFCCSACLNEWLAKRAAQSEGVAQQKGGTE